MTKKTLLPSTPGSYILLLKLTTPQAITIGALGEAQFPAGIYAYLGSARGPGGIRARLGRHIAGSKIQRWHIDYLRAQAEIGEYTFLTELNIAATAIPTECRWSQALAQLPAAQIPLAQFGARDCRHSCPAHLVLLPPGFELSDLRHLLTA
ncbi:MAG: GIY-YIG nuclease family protein [Anaerolineae bacterium]|nr:GIY-YIG nuclease family protein [Anaerolineae bacterium]